ncbi:MAG: hypothetical protein HA495_06035 [Thaumarchaeota archaeon]|jgi:hypothetical protein|nr:hypothetical protein [Nitrososphaerota archaeon]
MREFFEVEDISSFMKVSRLSELVIRLDPFLFVNVYGIVFYLDLSKKDPKEISNLFTSLSDKIIFSTKAEVSTSFKEFLKSKIQEK